jgi:hypothetical protein
LPTGAGAGVGAGIEAGAGVGEMAGGFAAAEVWLDEVVVWIVDGDLSEVETQDFFLLTAFEFIFGVAVGSGSMSSVMKKELELFDKMLEP